MNEDTILRAQHPLYDAFCRADEPVYDPDSGYYNESGEWVSYDDMDKVEDEYE